MHTEASRAQPFGFSSFLLLISYMYTCMLKVIQNMPNLRPNSPQRFLFSFPGVNISLKRGRLSSVIVQCCYVWTRSSKVIREGNLRLSVRPFVLLMVLPVCTSLDHVFISRRINQRSSLLVVPAPPWFFREALSYF